MMRECDESMMRECDERGEITEKENMIGEKYKKRISYLRSPQQIVSVSGKSS
jgi:hypothetical protein